MPNFIFQIFLKIFKHYLVTSQLVMKKIRIYFIIYLKNFIKLYNIFKYMDEGKSVDNKDNQAESGIIQEKITQANGEIKIKKYSKGKALGRGGFAKCYEVTNLENKRVLAAKIIAKNSLSRSRAKQKVTDLFNFS